MNDNSTKRKSPVRQFIVSGALLLLSAAALVYALPLKKDDAPEPQPAQTEEPSAAEETAGTPIFRVYDGEVQNLESGVWVSMAGTAELLAADPLSAPDALAFLEEQILPEKREEVKISFVSTPKKTESSTAASAPAAAPGSGGGAPAASTPKPPAANTAPSAPMVDTGAEESSDYL